MNKFTDGAPRTPKEWVDLGLTVFPCNANGIPGFKNWQEGDINSKALLVSKTYKDNVIALRLDNHVDLDIDNPIMQKFLGDVICGAKFGRNSNPLSHLLFEGVTDYESVAVPAAFEKYFKHFPHGNLLLDIRHGTGHFTYVPGGFRPYKKNSGAEILEWIKFTGFHKYDTRTNALMKEICLKTSLSVMFPPLGQRDTYMTSIAGILAHHTDWTDEKINSFCFDLAFKSGSTNPARYSNKGSDARKDKKTFGIPKLAEILEVEPSDVAKLFSWVGVKDAGSMFSALRVYETEPKYWQLKYKDKWITIMDSSMLLSYTKISILILENCYEVAPVINPKDWKSIVHQLLQNVEKIDAPLEASYYGVIMNNLVEWMNRMYSTNKKVLAEPHTVNPIKSDGYYYFKLQDVMSRLKRYQQSFEIRKLTHHLREMLGAEDIKESIGGRQIRVWRVKVNMIDEHYAQNQKSNPKDLLPKTYQDPEVY